MRDAPSRILLVVAPTVHLAKAWARGAGLSPALGLGAVRIVTSALGLRGWRDGTLVTIVARDLIDRRDRQEIELALDVFLGTGRLRLATDSDIDTMKREMAA